MVKYLSLLCSRLKFIFCFYNVHIFNNVNTIAYGKVAEGQEMIWIIDANPIILFDDIQFHVIIYINYLI